MDKGQHATRQHQHACPLNRPPPLILFRTMGRPVDGLLSHALFLEMIDQVRCLELRANPEFDITPRPPPSPG